MQLVTTNTPLTMSSLKIAELTGKEHRNVIRDIRKMLTDIHGEKDALSFEHIYPDAYGRKQPCFQLDEAHTATLLTGYDAKARFAVTSEWLEMKKAPPQINLDDPAALRPLLLSYTEKVIELQEVVAEQAPKVAALERLSNADGLFSIRDTAKVLGLQEKTLIGWLLEHGWLYRAPATTRLCGYAKHIQSGHLKVIDVLSNDEKHAWPQVKVTQKGITRLGCLLEGVSEDEDDGVITLRELNELAVTAAKAVGPQRVLSIIGSFGAVKLAGIDTDKYPDLKLALMRAANEPF